MQVQSLDQEASTEKEIATCSSIVVWKIPWTEEPGELQSEGSQRVSHDRVTKHTCKQRKRTWKVILCAFALSYPGSFAFVSGEISEFLFFPTRELKKKKPTLLKRKKSITNTYIQTREFFSVIRRKG